MPFDDKEDEVEDLLEPQNEVADVVESAQLALNVSELFPNFGICVEAQKETYVYALIDHIKDFTEVLNHLKSSESICVERKSIKGSQRYAQTRGSIRSSC